MVFLIGRVCKVKMNKTVVVLVKKLLKLDIYNKSFFNFRKVLAHDIFNFCNNDDSVLLIQVKPVSKKKFWMVIKIF